MRFMCSPVIVTSVVLMTAFGRHELEVRSRGAASPNDLAVGCEARRKNNTDCGSDARGATCGSDDAISGDVAARNDLTRVRGERKSLARADQRVVRLREL